jgi:CMP-N-acetylneuraminic acid synthetase
LTRVITSRSSTAPSYHSQELPPAYALNGAIYVIPAEDARDARPIVRPGVIPFVMTDIRESMDIDTADDWALASYWADGLAHAQKVRDSNL